MKYVLVTGACGGMGTAAVLALHDAGYFVFALDKHVFENRESILPIATDITNEESVLKAFAQVREVTDKLDVIIHFAGTYCLDSLVEIGSDQLDKVFSVNLFGACRVNRVFLPLLHNGSRIILTTSELAPLDPLPFTGIYAITKAALDKYAYSLRMELQLLGISVIVLRPGAVQTNMLGVSTAALDKFCQNTKLYTCNAKRFRRVVERVEARCIKPKKVAQKIEMILNRKRVRYVYSLNRNPLLLLLNALPCRLQTWIIRCILK